MSIKYRLRLLTNMVLEKLNIPKIPPRIPIYFVEVTNKCNLNCDFCPRNDLSRGTGDMEFDLFKLVIKKIKEKGANYLNLNRFGESLTHPQFLKMLRYAKSKGIPNVGLVTNGQLLDHEMVENIVDAGIDRINISLDTLDREKYEKARKGAKLDNTINNLEYLIEYRNKVRKNKPVIAIFSVLVTDDYEQMKTIFQTYVNRVNYIEFRPIANYGSSQHLKDLPHIKTKKENLLTCIQPWQRLNIFYNGDVNPCCGDVDGELVIGNIKDSSIEELWHNEKIKRIRRILTRKTIDKLPVCLSCDGCNLGWRQEALLQLRKVYHKLDPDINVVDLTATTPTLFRHSTKKLWR